MSLRAKAMLSQTHYSLEAQCKSEIKYIIGIQRMHLQISIILMKLKQNENTMKCSGFFIRILSVHSKYKDMGFRLLDIKNQEQ